MFYNNFNKKQLFNININTYKYKNNIKILIALLYKNDFKKYRQIKQLLKFKGFANKSYSIINLLNICIFFKKLLIVFFKTHRGSLSLLNCYIYLFLIPLFFKLLKNTNNFNVNCINSFVRTKLSVQSGFILYKYLYSSSFFFNDSFKLGTLFINNLRSYIDNNFNFFSKKNNILFSNILQPSILRNIAHPASSLLLYFLINYLLINNFNVV